MCLRGFRCLSGDWSRMKTFFTFIGASLVGRIVLRGFWGIDWISVERRRFDNWLIELCLARDSGFGDLPKDGDD